MYSKLVFLRAKARFDKMPQGNYAQALIFGPFNVKRGARMAYVKEKKQGLHAPY